MGQKMEIKQNIYQKRLELFHLVNELQRATECLKSL